MIIKRKSPVSGQWNEREIDINPNDLVNWYDGKVFMTVVRQWNPNMTDDDQEFIVSGMTPEDWAELSSFQLDALQDSLEPIDYEIHPYVMEA